MVLHSIKYTLHHSVFQLLGTFRFVRRWVVIIRVLNRAWKELWTLSFLLMLLILFSTHLGKTVKKEKKPKSNMNKNWIWHLCSGCSSSRSPWKAFCRCIRFLCRWCPLCAVGLASNDYAGSILFSALCMAYYWRVRVSGFWLNSLALFSFGHTGTVQHLWLFFLPEKWPKQHLNGF